MIDYYLELSRVWLNGTKKPSQQILKRLIIFVLPRMLW